jgi:aryl-alcohol dehydrogenase
MFFVAEWFSILNAMPSEKFAPRGTCAIIGASKPDNQFFVDMNDVMQNGKSIRGVVEGDSVPDIFIPPLVDLYMQARFPLDRLVRYYPFEAINQAAEDSEKGYTIKPIILIDPVTG